MVLRLIPDLSISMINPFLPRVAFTQADDMVGSACWWYRTHLPSTYYKIQGGSVVDPGSADIIHVARMGARSRFDILRKLKAQGKKIVYDLDDDFWSLSYDVCKNAIPGYLNTVNETAALCDAVIVTTQSLADAVIKATGKSVYVAPNFLCTKSWGGPAKLPDFGNKPVLLASGGNGHIDDFKILADISS